MIATICALLSLLSLITILISWRRTVVSGREVRAIIADLESQRQILHDLTVNLTNRPFCYNCGRHFTPTGHDSWEHLDCSAQKETP